MWRAKMEIDDFIEKMRDKNLTRFATPPYLIKEVIKN